MAKKKIVDFHRSPEAQIFKLRVSLPETKPEVWRRILVPGLFTLEALHSVIQLTMGWQMKHLYDFKIGRDRYSDPDDFDDHPVKLPAATLASALRDQSSFTYTYDFGDDWRHQIEVEEILLRDEAFNYPICIGGENACPPEDCHGFHGYMQLLLKKRQKRAEAKDLIPQLLWHLNELLESPWEPLQTFGRTLKSWIEPTVRMWRFSKNNGITEGFHTKMEMISRRAFGFRNFRNYRLRVIALCGWDEVFAIRN